MSGLPGWVWLPVVGPQALWVASRALRLPEAAGPREGAGGAGLPLRVLILGDSSAAGVGVAHQDHALAGRLAAHLGQRYAVQWRLVARTGLTSSGMLRMLSAEPDSRFDVAVVALGVNDAKNGVHPTRWQANYTALLNRLKGQFGVQRIYASGVPPLGAFPLLPWPLRDVLGARAARFDALLADLCAGAEGAVHLPFDLPLAPELMADDGFHPGAQVYDLWAHRVAEHVRAAPLL